MPKPSVDLSGRTAIVTGGSRGIGYAVAEAFADAGADVHIVAESGDVHQAAERLRLGEGRKVTAHRCDIADRAAVEALVTEIPRPDILVNNAGLEALTWIDDARSETFELVERIGRINVVGTWSVTQAFLPAMIPGASIICTASIWSRTAEPGFSALRGIQARDPGLGPDVGQGAWSERHSGQCRGAGLGAHRRGAAFGGSSGAGHWADDRGSSRRGNGSAVPSRIHRSSRRGRRLSLPRERLGGEYHGPVDPGRPRRGARLKHVLGPLERNYS